MHKDNHIWIYFQIIAAESSFAAAKYTFSDGV